MLKKIKSLSFLCYIIAHSLWTLYVRFMNFSPLSLDSSTVRSSRQIITSSDASSLFTFLQSDFDTDDNCRWDAFSNVYQSLLTLSCVRAIVTKIMFFKMILGMKCDFLKRKMSRSTVHDFCDTEVDAINFWSLNMWFFSSQTQMCIIQIEIISW